MRVRDMLKVGETYRYGWHRMGRKDQLCILQVIAPRMNTVQVQFEDGYQAITSANALKKPGKSPVVSSQQLDLGD